MSELAKAIYGSSKRKRVRATVTAVNGSTVNVLLETGGALRNIEWVGSTPYNNQVVLVDFLSSAPIALTGGENPAVAAAQGQTISSDQMGLPANLLSGVGCRVYRSSNQLDITAAIVAVIFTTESRDMYNMWRPATDPSRVYIPYDGFYMAFVSMAWEPNATGQRIVQLLQSGVGGLIAQSAETAYSAIYEHRQSVSGGLYCNKGSYFSVQVGQTSGVPLDLLGGVDSYKATLTVIRQT